ncbi:MAG: c-type cytochrome [Flavisolibacter sp.]
MKVLRSRWFLYFLFLVAVIFILTQWLGWEKDKSADNTLTTDSDSAWVPPTLDTDPNPQGKEREQLIYGADLIANTAKYMGPKGSVLHISNGLNCQNCHLDAGTRTWGNNFGAVAATYPKFRPRSGKVADIFDRINGCFERSMNGQKLDKNSREMQAMAAYINWIGRSVPKGEKPTGTALEAIPYIDRAADPQKGQIVFNTICQRCHGANGEGTINPDSVSYTYPPLWGPHSYNDGAGLYRLSKFASFVHNNMPFNEAFHNAPKLTLEQAWDVAAFVNSQPRPHKDAGNDWPDISKKPVDHPFGPYADSFPEQQHKYGPFKPIEAAKKK